MSFFHAIRHRMRSVFRAPSVEREREEEFAFHHALAEQELLRGDAGEEEARHVARREFGNATYLGEEMRQMSALRWLDALAQDLRFGWRQLQRAPFFTMIACVSVAAGVIVAVSAFTLVNAVLFKPLPIPDGDRIYHLYTSDYNGRSRPYGSTSFRDYEDFARSGVFASLAARSWMPIALSVDGEPPHEHWVDFVSDNYFQSLGLRLERGTGFRDGDPFEIVITYSFWRRQLGGAEDVIGRTIRINTFPFTIVGVAPQAFRGIGFGPMIVGWTHATALPTVMRNADQLASRSSRGFGVFGRLRAGETAETAAQRLNALAHSLAQQYPGDWLDVNRETRLITLLPHRKSVGFPAQRAELMFMIVAVSLLVTFIVLLACTNVAALLLGRAVSREGEVVVRLTLGASRARLIRQFLTESLLLAAMGGIISFIGLLWTIRLVGRMPMVDIFDLRPDWRVFLAAALTSLVCALLFGLAPALQSLPSDLRYRLAAVGSVRRHRMRGALISLQVAISGVLIVMALTTVRGLRTYLRTDPGMDADGLVALEIDTRFFGGDSVARGAYMRRVPQLVAELPGVQSFASTVLMPLGGTSTSSMVRLPDGREYGMEINTVGNAFFATVGVAPVRGRVFAETDRAQSARVAVVNRAFVQRHGDDLLGRLIGVSEREGILIVGVVPEIQYHEPRRVAEPLIYLVDEQAPRASSRQRMLLRVAPGSERTVVSDLRQRLRQQFPDLILPYIEPIRDYMQRQTTPHRIGARVALAVGAIELLLASIGLYGLLLFALSARRREIGVRLALGASPRQASWTVLRDGVRYAAFGTIAAIVLSVPATLVAQRGLPGARFQDPVPFAVALITVALAAAFAAFLSARRAGAVAPAAALRAD